MQIKYTSLINGEFDGLVFQMAYTFLQEAVKQKGGVK